MDSGFVDLDILLTRIRNPPSKRYFLDAVRAYKAGALRGALASAWVAIVFDLIAKYRELAAIGDAAAIGFLNDWDTATAGNDITRLLKLETSIVADATEKTQILNHISKTHLERLREDRNYCAHPAFSTEAELFEPSAELVRLHLVNAVDLVLAVEALQGKAIFEQFDLDVQSTGFPTTYARILDYVEQRYLVRVRPANLLNFGTVLAKSLLKGTPPQWEAHSRKILCSLVALRERSATAWPSISDAIVRLLDELAPEHRARGIAFVADFPDFWAKLQQPTHMALQETIENADVAALVDFRILSGARVPLLKEATAHLIVNLTETQVQQAISETGQIALWPRALDSYRASGSYRNSESNFGTFITPFSGQLSTHQNDELLDAIIFNGQNWDAGGTPGLLIGLLRDAAKDQLPSLDARNRFHEHMSENKKLKKFSEVFEFLMEDGWKPLEKAPEF